MISALQHFLFCPRQCALIYNEQVWEENRLTAEGRLMHQHVHEQGQELRGKVKIARGVHLRSRRLGLVGMADVVEFHLVSEGVWQPFPVEYKRGKPKFDHTDAVQLCAQALCLEEMMDVHIPRGALYYGRTHHRHDVLLDDALRAETIETAAQVRQLLESGRTPAPVYAKKCDNCSLVGECLPEPLTKRKSVKKYLDRVLGAA
ncbi:MAG: CRISPR-associated protein Cas4 [candidate division WOR-3 bacterium]